MTYKFQSEWPPYSSDPSDVLNLDPTKPLSNDLEWDALERPDVIGNSDGTTHVSVSYEEGVEYFIHFLKTHPNVIVAGHNFVGADLPLLEKRGIHISLENIDDTIIWHYLVNMHLCKASGKSALDEENGTDLRGRGFMNLGTFSSIYTNYAHWKTCRGEGCSGPCPKHQPRWYNAMDCASVAEGLPKVKMQARLRGVDKLYPLHRELAWVLANTREYGVRVDVPFVDSLQSEFEQEKSLIAETLPFNPDSPKQVMDFFRAKKIILPNAQEKTVRDKVDDLGEEESPVELIGLLDYKEMGNGVNRWFQRYYRDSNGWLQGFMDDDGWVHPRLGMFTSSGRLQCTGPNLQNVPKRRRSRKMCECEHGIIEHTPKCHCGCEKFTGLALGKRVRQAIIAPDGWYIVRADLSNAENRVVLHRGGHKIPSELDLHPYVAELCGFTPDMEICIKEGGPREAAKTVAHANHIHEGLQLKTREALYSSTIKREIAAGARVVYSDWTFCGRVVTFTGANLAQRAFGSKTYENRARALKVAEQYFNRFPGVRQFQREVSKACDRDNSVRTPAGYVLLSFGDPDDRMKIAQGVQQQNPVGHVIKIAMLNCWRRWERERKMRCVLSVHDELLCYVRDDVAPDVAGQWLREDMEVEGDGLPGLVIPAEASYGKNWREQTKLE